MGEKSRPAPDWMQRCWHKWDGGAEKEDNEKEADSRDVKQKTVAILCMAIFIGFALRLPFVCIGMHETDAEPCILIIDTLWLIARTCDGGLWGNLSRCRCCVFTCAL